MADDNDFDELAVPIGRTQVPISDVSTTRVHTSQHEVEGVGLFTVMVQDMGKSVFVWCSTGRRNLGDVVSATPIPPTAVPTGQSGASSLLLAGGNGESRDEAESFAAKLGTKLRRLVLLSWEVGPEHDVASGVLQQVTLSAVQNALGSH